MGDGVLVGARPELQFWRDTDGDGRADHKTVVATDYGVMLDPQREGLSNAENSPNGLLPQFRGDIFIGEPVANFVRREILVPGKGTLVGRNAYNRTEFITLQDERFRPVNFTTGPDGALGPGRAEPLTLRHSDRWVATF